MNKRAFSLVEMVVTLAVGLILLGITAGVVINETRIRVEQEYKSDIDFRSRNFHKMMSRDILLAGSMASSWDSLPPIRVNGDTLLIRFSTLDSVRYFLDGVDRIHREDVPIAVSILSFTVEQDSVAIHVSLDVGATSTHRWVNGGNVYHRNYEWTVVPNNTFFRMQ